MEFNLITVLSWGLPLLAIAILVAVANWLLERGFANHPNNKLYRVVQSGCIGIGHDRPGLVATLRQSNSRPAFELVWFGLNSGDRPVFHNLGQ